MFKIEEYPTYIGEIIYGIEEKEDKMKVIYHKEWLIPFHKYNININSTVYKNISIIEEFILKIGLSDIENNITKEFISDMLGLDIIFIESYVNKLIRVGMIDVNKLPQIVITDKGKSQYESKRVFHSIKNDVFQAYYHPGINNVYDYKNKKIENIDILNFRPIIPERIDNINEELRDKIINLAKAHKIIPVKNIINQELSSITIEKAEKDIVYAKILELWVYDIVEKTLQCRVWNYQMNSFDNDISKYITYKKPLEKEDFILPVNIDNTYINNTPNHLEEKFIEDNKENNENKRSFRIIRGKEIKNEFNKTFDMVKSRMYIQSPWISSNVVDGEMIKKIKKLAANNCKVFITWGISKDENHESRKPSNKLLEELKSIKSPDKLPAVFVIWIGNHHNKEIIVDNKIHIAGSFNWLSYRGDYLPRGESVYLTNDIECIEEAKYYLEEQIVNSLRKDILNEDFYSNITCLLNLEYHEEKINEILDNTVDKLLKNYKSDDKLKFLMDLLKKYEKYPDRYIK